MSDGSTEYTGPTGSTGPAPPVVITIDDILNSAEVLRQKELADKSALDGIGSASLDSLRPTLIQWASMGLPNAYVLMSIPIAPPSVCSDGVSRGLADYITFCSGKSIADHVAELQAKLVGMTVSFANMGSAISIVVSKD